MSLFSTNAKLFSVKLRKLTVWGIVFRSSEVGQLKQRGIHICSLAGSSLTIVLPVQLVSEFLEPEEIVTYV